MEPKSASSRFVRKVALETCRGLLDRFGGLEIPHFCDLCVEVLTGMEVSGRYHFGTFLVKLETLSDADPDESWPLLYRAEVSSCLSEHGNFAPLEQLDP
ncbi:MAG: hypothetical protein RMJ19_05560 [Gemmatales bacterium]|nr:hypothetical protein [Gemmatales bacterium]MDW8175120.1 hypothetical protein [Gemmatales bacterium]